MLALKDIGILPAKEKQFNKKGIFEVNDLLSFFPRKYNDFSKKTGLLSDGDLVSCFVMHITKIDYHEPKSKGAPDVLCASGYDVDSRNVSPDSNYSSNLTATNSAASSWLKSNHSVSSTYQLLSM